MIKKKKHVLQFSICNTSIITKMLGLRNTSEYSKQNMKCGFMLNHLQDLSYQTTKDYTLADK